MGLKDGYKQTEVGIIPDDWDVARLGDVFDFKNGLNKEKKYFGIGTPIVNYMDVYKNRALMANDFKGKVTVSNMELKNYNVRKDDVFFTRTSETIEEIGISSVIIEDVQDTVFSGFVLRARPKNNWLDTLYKKYCFSSETVRKEITSKSSYTTRALTNGRLLSEVQIPRPPLPEQQAIAEALSDADSLITSLDQLITKKRNIKQGAMQQLLTGKKRLASFNEHLGDGCLGSLFVLSPSRKPTKNNEKVTFLGMEDVSEDGQIIRQSEMPFSQVKKGLTYFGRNDVLVAKITPCFENGKGACLDKLKTEKGFGSTEFHVLRAKDNAIPRYIFYQTQTESFRKKLETEMTGTAGQKRVPSSAIINYPLPILHSKEEQKAIAQVLSDMDAEMEKLEQQRDKYKAVKQGMMQELLTGKTRLVKLDAEAATIDEKSV